MRTHQPGIPAQGTRSHYYLELAVRPDVDHEDLLAALRSLREPPVTAGGSNIVIALGPRLWSQLAPDDTPADHLDFEPIGDPTGFHAPATQQDLWLWFHGTNADVVLDMARAAAGALAGVATVVTEQPAFVYHDSRDMTGFIDGTENPPIWEFPEVALVDDGQPGAGGSHVLVMKWVHDLRSFSELSRAQQEDVIGRTKPDSVELDDKPARAHIARVVIEEDGEELEIFRRSTPFGDIGEQGLMFVGFSADPTRFTKMLRRMFGVEDGISDHLTDFSTPVTGARYFAPALQSIEAALAEKKEEG